MAARCARILHLVALGLLLTACGGRGGGNAGPSSPAALPPTTAAVTANAVTVPPVQSISRPPAVSSASPSAQAARASSAMASSTLAVTALPTTIPATVWADLHRPLHLPTLAAGAACPRSPLLGPPSGNVVGTAPAFDAIDPDGTVHLDRAIGPPPDGWYYIKNFWSTTPAYRGPLLIRGGQLDGANAVRFLEGPGPDIASSTAERHLDDTSPELNHSNDAEGGRRWGGYTLFRAPGCYAYQVDGLNFSEVIVIQVVQR